MFQKNRLSANTGAVFPEFDYNCLLNECNIDCFWPFVRSLFFEGDFVTLTQIVKISVDQIVSVKEYVFVCSFRSNESKALFIELFYDTFHDK